MVAKDEQCSVSFMVAHQCTHLGKSAPSCHKKIDRPDKFDSSECFELMIFKIQGLVHLGFIITLSLISNVYKTLCFDGPLRKFKAVSAVILFNYYLGINNDHKGLKIQLYCSQRFGALLHLQVIFNYYNM